MSKKISILKQHKRIGLRIERLRFRLLVGAIEAEGVKKSSRESRTLRHAERELTRIKSELDDLLLESVPEADAATRCYYPIIGRSVTDTDKLIEQALLANGEDLTA